MNEQWTVAATTDDLIEDDVIGVEIMGKDLAIYLIEDEVFVTDNICTHGLAKLSDGFVEDGQVECPLHQGKFCIKSGKAMCAPLETDVQTYPSKIDGCQVLVNLT